MIDAGSSDGTAAAAAAAGAIVVTAPGSRAEAMNAGAAAGVRARCCCSCTPTPTLPAGAGGGDRDALAACRRAAPSGSASTAAAGRERLVNARSRAVRVVYGDQALFASAGGLRAGRRLPAAPDHGGPRPGPPAAGAAAGWPCCRCGDHLAPPPPPRGGLRTLARGLADPAALPAAGAAGAARAPLSARALSPLEASNSGWPVSARPSRSRSMSLVGAITVAARASRKSRSSGRWRENAAPPHTRIVSSVTAIAISAAAALSASTPTCARDRRRRPGRPPRTGAPAPACAGSSPRRAGRG